MYTNLTFKKLTVRAMPLHGGGCITSYCQQVSQYISVHISATHAPTERVFSTACNIVAFEASVREHACFLGK